MVHQSENLFQGGIKHRMDLLVLKPAQHRSTVGANGGTRSAALAHEFIDQDALLFFIAIAGPIRTGRYTPFTKGTKAMADFGGDTATGNLSPNEKDQSALRRRFRGGD